MPDKYIYDQLVAGKEDDSFYTGYAVVLLRKFHIGHIFVLLRLSSIYKACQH